MSEDSYHNFDRYGAVEADALDALIFEAPAQSDRGDIRMTALAKLANVPIETSLVRDLSGSLHTLFDPVCDKTLPIYFGPLLGRLYLEGL